MSLKVENRAELIAQAFALVDKPNYSKEDKAKFDSLIALANVLPAGEPSDVRKVTSD